MWCFCAFFLQAKYIAQIIVMGAQVVGRAFARALQQEYAGNCSEIRLYWWGQRKTKIIYSSELMGISE